MKKQTSPLQAIAAVSTAFVLAACSRVVPEENAFCARTGERSFAIQTNMVGENSTLYSSENMTYDPANNLFRGEATTTGLATTKAADVYGLQANLLTGQCSVKPHSFFDMYSVDYYTIKNP